MKAVRFSRFGGPEVLEMVDLPDPHPGPGEVRIAVRAAGINPSDWKKRSGLMDEGLPQTLGYEAAGVVDELGAGVADVAVGDRVFGFSTGGAAQAELAVLSHYAPIPPSLGFPGAAALPAAVETATRALDRLGTPRGATLLISGASGSVGGAAVQLAVVRGVRVIGTAGPAHHDYLRSLGAEAVSYGSGLTERVRALAPDGVDAALDVAGSGILPELIALAGGPERVVTIADFRGAREHGVVFSSGDDGRAVHALAGIGELVESQRFSLPVARTFPLSGIAEAHHLGEQGLVRGKLVLEVDFPEVRVKDTRTDRGSRVIAAPPAAVYRALLDRDSLQAWLPPDGMRGLIERWDPRPGGGFRMVLTYLDPVGGPGKTSDATDVVDVGFAELVPSQRVVQRAVFEADDPAYAGTMTMTWQIVGTGDGSEVTVTATGVPPGIDQAVHEAGIASSLANLASHVEDSG